MLQTRKTLLLIIFCILALLLGATLSVQASLFDSLLNRNANVESELDFLPVEKAFQISGERVDDNIIIKFTITPGHYLYQHMLHFEPVDSTKTQLGQPALPKGELKYDQFLKKNLETYPTTFEFPIPATTQEKFPEITVTFQGCAEAGLCYPPTSVNFVPLLASATTENAPPAVVDTPTTESKQETAENDEDHFLNSLLSDANLFQILLLFYLAGLTLTFTPCVLPMIPIVSSMVISSHGTRKHKALLTSSYVLAMALTYAIAGVLMGIFGASLNLQARLQSPWLLIPFAIVFVLLALAMFGLYELQLPEKLRDRLTRIDQKTGTKYQGTLTGAALAGVFSSLLVSPCVSAPLVGALVFISSTGNVAIGGLSLFALGLGMGTPLFIVGAGGINLLPKAGQWMEGTKRAFGLLMLGVAIWLLERLIPGHITMLLWSTLAIGAAICLGGLDFNQKQGWAIFRQVLGVLLLIYGVTLFVGSIQGHSNPLQPLTPAYQAAPSHQPDMFTQGESTPPATIKPMTVVKTSAELEAALAQAAAVDQPAFLDIYADWCISCKGFERNILPDPDIQQHLSPFAAIKLDITANSDDHRQIMKKLNIFGPPAYVFYSPSGELLKNLQKQGEISKEVLISSLKKAALAL